MCLEMHSSCKGLKAAQNVRAVGKKTLVFLSTITGIQGQVSYSLVGCHLQDMQPCLKFPNNKRIFQCINSGHVKNQPTTSCLSTSSACCPVPTTVPHLCPLAPTTYSCQPYFLLTYGKMLYGHYF